MQAIFSTIIIFIFMSTACTCAKTVSRTEKTSITNPDLLPPKPPAIEDPDTSSSSSASTSTSSKKKSSSSGSSGGSGGGSGSASGGSGGGSADVGTILISQPDGDADSVIRGNSFDIIFSGDAPNSVATISLYYKNTDTECSTGLNGWQVIATGIAESSTTYSWNTANVPIEALYVCAVITDGVNNPVYSVSSGALTVIGTNFISTWRTDNPGLSEDDQITLPLVNGGNYNFVVDWGDGNQDTITSYNQAETTHTYAVADSYVVTISGTIDGWQFNNTGDKTKITDISQWGSLKLGNSGAYFYGADNLAITATDYPDLSGITTMESAFRECGTLTTVPNMENWNIGSISNMNSMFYGAISFDQPLTNWDVSAVTNMAHMFRNASSFNQDISGWDTSSLVSMSYMFYGASAFDQDISAWDTSNVQFMSLAFQNASAFNQNLSSWDVSAATDMSAMFQGTALTTANYSSMLISWSKQNPPARTFGAQAIKYSAGTAASRRGVLTGTHSWTITDGGVDANWPSSGTFTATTNTLDTSFTLNWSAGSDAVTSTANLEYFVCSGSDALAIDTAPECLAATQEMDWTANTLTLDIAGKDPLTTYYYNVVMRDEAGDKVVYNGKAVTTNAPNAAPIISSISDQNINENSNTGSLNFTITDAEDTLNCASSMSKASSNITLVPTANIVFGGSAPNCTVTVTPAVDEIGISNITITVTDGVNAPVDEVFQVTVNALTPPSAVFSINAAAAYTNSTNATLTLSDATHVFEYRKANGADCSAASWTSYSGPIAHALAGGDGAKTVCLQVRDVLLNASTTQTDAITLDETLPDSAFTVAANLGPLSTVGANTTISGTASDVTSGVAAVHLAFKNTATDQYLNAGTFNSATPVWYAATGTTSWSYDLADNVLTNGVTYEISSRATDAATNAQSTLTTDSFTWVNVAPVANDITPAAFDQDTASIITLDYTDTESDLATSCAVANLTNVTETSACTCNAGVCTVVVTGTASYVGAASFTYTVTASAQVSNSATASLTINAALPATPFTIHQVTLTSDGSSGNTNFRVVVPASEITSDGNSIRVKLHAKHASGAPDLRVDAASICERSGSGYNCMTTPKRITFNGGSGISIPEDGTAWSDWVNFTVDETKDYLVNFYNAASNFHYRIAGAGLTYMVGDAANYAMEASPAGTWSTMAWSLGIELIEASWKHVPSISDVTNRSIDENGSSGALPFTISDADSTLSCATSLSAWSSDGALIPLGGIVFGGTAPNCTVTMTPGANLTGSATVILTVSDGILSAHDVIGITVAVPATEHTIFVSSETFAGNFLASYNGQTFLTALEGADYRCNHLANLAGLPEYYTALISTSSVNAKDRITWVGPIYNTLTTPEKIADTAAEMWSSGLQNAVNYNENGDLYDTAGGTSARVWTGTLSDGSKDSTTCSDWTVGTSAADGTRGQANSVGGGVDGWLYWNVKRGCNSTYRLYCVSN